MGTNFSGIWIKGKRFPRRKLIWKCCLQKCQPSLQWRHNGHDGVSNHQPHHYLLNRLFGRRSKKTSKLCITGLCVTGEFPAQMASNAENVSVWWRHHDFAHSQRIKHTGCSRETAMESIPWWRIAHTIKKINQGSDRTLDWTTVTDVMDERDFTRFEFRMSFGRISYIT